MITRGAYYSVFLVFLLILGVKVPIWPFAELSAQFPSQ